jgi:hypothetical protein
VTQPIVLVVKRLAVAIALAHAWVFLAQVECIQQPARSQHAQGTLSDGIEAVHHAAGVKVATHAVEAG